jgi:hypothetical protein
MTSFDIKNAAWFKTVGIDWGSNLLCFSEAMPVFSLRALWPQGLQQGDMRASNRLNSMDGFKVMRSFPAFRGSHWQKLMPDPIHHSWIQKYGLL